jgi:hypothetical protein
MPKTSISAEQLRALLTYDPLTGEFRWLKRGAGRPVDRIAGGLAPTGYRRIRIHGIEYLAHRLAWVYVTGSWPIHSIDHIDGDPANNAIANLRDVPHRVNLQNRRSASTHSRTGLLGASLDRRSGRYASFIRLGDKQTCLGLFDTATEAHEAYVSAKRIHHEGNTL